MSGSSQHLTLFQDRCDQCGTCRTVCPHNALKIGTAFIYVDWRKCDGCLTCVEVCDRNAIVSRVVPLRSSSVQSTVGLSDVNKVVVGSRAEAKAVRKAAERADKEKKNPKTPKKPAAAKTPAREVAAVKPVPAPLSAKRIPEKAATPSAVGPSPVAWTMLDAAAVLAVMLLALVAKNAVLGLGQVALMPQLGKMVVRAVVFGAYYVAQLAAFGWLAGRHGMSATEAFGLRRAAAGGSDRPSAAGSAGLVLALLVACEVVSISYGLAMRALGVAPPERLTSDLAGVFGSGPTGFVVACALVVLAAPFTEEIAFRAILLPAIGGRWGMWFGIGVSSVLYAAFHANLWLFVPSVVLGVACGWLAWTRRSLWPAVALHVLFNSAAIAAAFATVK